MVVLQRPAHSAGFLLNFSRHKACNSDGTTSEATQSAATGLNERKGGINKLERYDLKGESIRKHKKMQ